MEGKEAPEILATMVQQHYLEAQDIPQEVLLSAEPDEAPAVEEWLTRRRGSPVSVRVPDGGEEAKLVALTRTNAQFLLDELKVQRLKRADSVPYGVASLQKDLRLEVLPRRIECFDISNTQGRIPWHRLWSSWTASQRRASTESSRSAVSKVRTISPVCGEVVERRFMRLLEEQFLPSPIS